MREERLQASANRQYLTPGDITIKIEKQARTGAPAAGGPVGRIVFRGGLMFWRQGSPWDMTCFKNERWGKIMHMIGTRRYNWTSLLIGIILALGGILALSNPDATYVTLAAILGIVAIVCGLMLLLNYYRIKEALAFWDRISLGLGTVLLVIGLIFLFWPVVAVSVFAYILAFLFIIYGLSRLSRASSFKHLGSGIYSFIVILNILFVIGGIVLIFQPVILGLTIALILGLLLLIYGILLIVSTFFGVHFYRIF